MTMGGSVMGWLGIDPSRDNGQADKAVEQYYDSMNGIQQNYTGATEHLNNQSDAIAKQNYLLGAQQNYQQQGQAAQMLYNQATGRMPSVADIQMQQGLANANNQIQSSALSQQGGVAPGLTQRNMLNAQAAQDAQIVGQGQANRAQEINLAQQNYANQLSGMTNQQMQMGQMQYGQAQNNLNYHTQNANNQAAFNSAAASNLWNVQDQNIQQAAGATSAQNQQIGNSINSVGQMVAAFA